MLSLTATDARTMVIKLKEPLVYAFSCFGGFGSHTGNIVILPKETDSGFDIRRDMIGNGPVPARQVHAVGRLHAQAQPRLLGQGLRAGRPDRAADRHRVRGGAGAVQGRQHPLHDVAPPEDCLPDQEGRAAAQHLRRRSSPPNTSVV